MKAANDFYQHRNQRTMQYAGNEIFDRHPVSVIVDDTIAGTQACQALVLALANQLARVHRRVNFILRDAPLQTWSLRSGSTIYEALRNTVYAIDPFGAFSFNESWPHSIRLGIGAPNDVCDWYVGADGARARLDIRPCSFNTALPGTVRGAALSACLGAAAVFRSQLGMRTSPRVLSAWNFAEGEDADRGPAEVSAVDVGRVLMVGAGAVAAALVYWLRVFGVNGIWVVVDKDKVMIHNLNRGMLFTADDAGWPDQDAAYKADVCAKCLPNCTSTRRWLHETQIDRDTDLILALANEYNVRTTIAQINAPLVLHATTGETWLSELHRHVPGRDDCIACRTRDVKAPTMGCSTAKVEDLTKVSSDAALPFLSAASGLMLATALQRLQAGGLSRRKHNNWKWYFDTAAKMTQKTVHICHEGCALIHPPELRKSLHQGKRWASLDPALMP